MKKSFWYKRNRAGNLCAIIAMILTIPHALSAQDPILAWTRYSGLEGESIDMVTDAAGNTYVAKEIKRGADRNTLTIKYSSTGSEVWRKEFIGLSGGTDTPVSIALDGSNNVYVLIKSFESGKAASALLKYNTDGILQWIRNYRRPFNHTFPYTVATDAATNEVVICVRGSVTDTPSPSPADAAGIIIIKYSSAGSQQWLSFYDRFTGGGLTILPNVLKIDLSGNIYIAGKTDRLYTPLHSNFGDQTLLKYSSSGEKIWERHFNDRLSSGMTDPSADELSGMEFDDSGNIYVCGFGFISSNSSYVSLAKYDAAGTLQWRQQERLIAASHEYTSNVEMAYYDSGNIYLAFTYGALGHTLKYDSDGRLHWQKTQAVVRQDRVPDIATDPVGNVLVATSGPTYPNAARSSVIQYDPAGNIVWEIPRHVGTTYSSIISLDFHSDNTFHVIGTRQIGEAGISRDYVSKYRFAGTDPPSSGAVIMPEGFARFDRVSFEMWARERDWCWTDLFIGWTCLVPPFCNDPNFSANLTYNGKTIWEQNFDKPVQLALPLSQDFRNFSLSMKVDDNRRDVIVLDENLVNKGLERLSFSTQPKDKFVSLKVSTVDGKEVPFTMTLISKEGKSIWHQSFVAPLEKEITDIVDQEGALLLFSGSIEPLSLNYYPNPFAGELTIRIANENGPAELTVYSLQGKKILHQPVTSGTALVKMQDQKPGLYILVLKTESSERRELIELK